MHIPDGYLSLQTSIPAVAVMTPIWALALKKIKKLFSFRQIPVLSLCAAFSFVIMMFNIPIGFSSVHAVGSVFIAILLGPWAACIAVSVALVIQALVFGDGGILTLGVNCFNMAFAMVFIGFFIYRAISYKSKFLSKRSIIGIFLGGYIGINFAALLTAMEVGIQPLLFTTAGGVPEFGFYPLSVSLPAMFFEHAFVAGPIEGIVTVGAISYLMKFCPQLFDRQYVYQSVEQSFFKKYKMFILGLFTLIILTPLGLIATGTAWGEWNTKEIKDKIGYVPKGLEHLSRFWKSIFPDYAIPGLHNGFFQSAMGYIASAVIGVFIIGSIMLLFIRKDKASLCTLENLQSTQNNEIPQWLLQNDDIELKKSRTSNVSFLRKSIAGVSGLVQNDLLSERNVCLKGLLQKIDGRVKLLTIIILMIFTGTSRNPVMLFLLTVLSFGLVLLSKLDFFKYFKRVWLIIPLIVLIVSIPAATNLFIQGKPVLYLFRDLEFILLKLPKDIYFTREGIEAVLKMSLRLGVSISFGYLLIMTTRWNGITKALCALRLPKQIIMILDMTYRYIFILSKLTIEMFEARYLRTVGKVKNKENRQFISKTIAFIFTKSNNMSEEIYDSMLCRGYTGSPVSLNEFKFSTVDFLWICFVVAFILGGVYVY